MYCVEGTASEMTYIVSSGALNSTHSLLCRGHIENLEENLTGGGVSVAPRPCQGPSDLLAKSSLAFISVQFHMTDRGEYIYRVAKKASHYKIIKKSY